MKLSSRFFILPLLLLFFLSGVAGLIYESIWTHYLKLFVGHAAYAQMLVLVIYMGGMALGSWIASRYTARMHQLLPVAKLRFSFSQHCVPIRTVLYVCPPYSMEGIPGQGWPNGLPPEVVKLSWSP